MTQKTERDIEMMSLSVNNGAIHGIQTHDLSITNRMLYQLS